MSKLLPLVSVIIPNHNNAPFLRRCISSVLNQSYKNIEVFLVDDGSTDESIRILESYKDKIEVIQIGKSNASNARNIGIDLSRGDLIAFLDSDDEWLPNKLQLQVDKMLSENLDLIYTAGYKVDSLSKVRTYVPAEFSGFVYDYFIQYPTKAIISLACSSALLKKNIISNSGKFDTSFGNFAEDWDFFRRVCKTAKVGKLDQPLLLYHQHSANQSKKSIRLHFKSNKKAVLKMIQEDSNLDAPMTIRIITRFYISYLKHIIKMLRLRGENKL